VAPEGLTERPGLTAPQLIQVPLGRAVVDLEAGRVTAVAGRCVAMPNQRNVPTRDERSPAIPGVTGGQARHDDDQHRAKNAESYASDRGQNA
jgi:hypothetical protein